MISGVNASSRLGGRTTEWGGVWEHPSPHLAPFGGLVGRVWATNIGYIRKYVIILGGDIPVDIPPTKILGDVSPASPAGLTPVIMMAN